MGIVNPLHIAFVAVVALLVLGPKRFPEVARSVGKGYREFREQLSAVTQQAHTDLTAPAPGTSTVPQATVVEQVSPEREVPLAAPTAETSVTEPAPPPPPPAA
jgi:TatA/E family protein of Tat protein translocase